MRVSLRRTADRLLTVAAVLGVAALLGTLLGAALGVRPLVFRSGSMAPAIDTGALALAREVPAADVRAGDVVSVRTAGGERVTHRVVRVEQGDASGQVLLVLRGDANRAVDPERYPVVSAHKVVWQVPWLGYAVAAVFSRAGLALLGLFVLALVVIARDRTTGRRRGPRGGRRARRDLRRRRVGAAVVAGVAVAAGPAAPASAAPWTDAVVISGTQVTTATIPAPSFACGALGVLSVTFTWSAVPGATSYTLHYGANGSTVRSTTSTSETVVSAISVGTAWVVANRSFGATTWSSVASNTRTYTVALVSLCS